MPKKLHADLKPSDKVCPHCDGGLEKYWSPRANGYGTRCLNCKCRFGLQGNHWFVGTFCPLQYQFPISV